MVIPYLSKYLTGTLCLKKKRRLKLLSDRGACSGTLSSCGLAGFALESRCHTGRTILFDVVNELKWAVDVRTHSIAQIIEHVLKPDWDANAQHQQALRLTPQTSRLFRIVRQLLSTYWEKNCMWWWGWGHKEPKEPQPPSHKNRSKSNVPQAAAEDDCVDCIKWGSQFYLSLMLPDSSP